MHIIGSITKDILKSFRHIQGDAHVYIDHIKAIGEQIHRIPLDFPKLVI